MDGYFEMGLNDSVEESVGSSSSTSLALLPAEEPGGRRGDLCGEEEEEEEAGQVTRVLWCYCLQVKEEVEQKEACLVLTDRLLGLLYLSPDFTRTNQDAGKRTIRKSILHETADNEVCGLRTETEIIVFASVFFKCILFGTLSTTC